MPISSISNAEVGSSVRTKLNSALTKLNQLLNYTQTSVSNFTIGSGALSTSIVGTGTGSLVVPANAISAGAILRLRFFHSMICNTGGASSPNSAYVLRINGTPILASTLFLVDDVGILIGGVLEGHIRSDSQFSGFYWNPTPSFTGGDITTAPALYAIDLTIQNTFDLYLNSNVSAGNMTVEPRHLKLEIINP